MQQCIHCKKLFDRKITKPPKTCSEECRRAVNRKRYKEYYLTRRKPRKIQQKAYQRRVKENALSGGLLCPCPSCSRTLS